ncbi:MAG: hypothetical protein ABID38_06475 [Candidatus Diapherotrites archaeon]
MATVFAIRIPGKISRTVLEIAKQQWSHFVGMRFVMIRKSVRSAQLTAENALLPM